MQYTDKYRSPLGEITLASDGDHLTGLWFDGQKYFAATLSAEHQERELPIFEQAKEWLDSYFMGKIPSFTPPIHLEDTPFRLAVWDLLTKIPYGEVVILQGARRGNRPAKRYPEHVYASDRRSGRP